MKILQYIVNSVPYMMLFLPIVVGIRAYRVRKLKKQGRRSPIYREVALVLFFLFYVGVASQTIIPKFEISIDGTLSFMRNYGTCVNLIPFNQVAVVVEEVINKGNISYLLVNICGNVCFFVPMGFAMPLLWKCSIQRVLSISLISAIMIELLQYIIMTGRATDIDDVIIYMVGTLLGYCAYSVCNKRFPKLCSSLRVDN